MKNKFVLPVIIIALLFLNVILSIVISGKGAQISSIEKKINQGMAQSRESQDKIINGSSLSQMQSSAPSLGLNSSQTIVYWNSDAGQLAKSQ